MHSFASALGSPLTIAHKGRKYTVSPLTQDAKAAFERRLIEQAMAAAALAPVSYRLALLGQVAREAAQGEYAFYGKAGQAALGSPSGLVLLASVLCSCEPTEAIELMAEKGPELSAILDLAVLESMPDSVRATILDERQQAAQATIQSEGQVEVPTQPAAG